jgi:hypothetical protein
VPPTALQERPAADDDDKDEEDVEDDEDGEHDVGPYAVTRAAIAAKRLGSDLPTRSGRPAVTSRLPSLMVRAAKHSPSHRDELALPTMLLREARRNVPSCDRAIC